MVAFIRKLENMVQLGWTASSCSLLLVVDYLAPRDFLRRRLGFGGSSSMLAVDALLERCRFKRSASRF
jgi:hypothetical protein